MTEHQLSLTRGAANLLAHIIATPGLLTDTADLYRLGEFSETHLADLAAGPNPPAKGKDASADEWAAFAAANKTWTRQPISDESITVKERTRESLKKAVKAAVDKGIVPGGGPLNNLLFAVGLAPE